MIDLFNRLCSGAFDAVLYPFSGLGELAQVAVVALFVGVAVALVFNVILDRVSLENARRDLRASLFEIWLYRHDAGVVLKAQWELVKANGRYLRAILPPLILAMLIISPVLVQSYHRFGLDPVPDGSEVLLTVEMGTEINDFAEAVPELVWASGRGTTTAMVRKPSVNQVVWRLHPDESGIHVLRLARGGQHEEILPLYVGSHGESVTQTRQTDSWRSLLQPRGAELTWDSGFRRVSIDYPEAAPAWLWWMTVVSLLSALVTNRFTT